MSLVLFVASLAPVLLGEGKPAQYPYWALVDQKSAAAMVELVVDPEGKAVSCSMSETRGDERLAGQICQILKKSRHGPAHLADGTKTFGVYRGLYKIWTPESEEGKQIGGLAETPGYSFTVQKLPSEEDSAQVLIALAVDKDGKVTDCGPDAQQQPGPMVDAVCANSAMLQQPSVSTKAGPIAYVTRVKAELVARP